MLTSWGLEIKEIRFAYDEGKETEKLEIINEPIDENSFAMNIIVNNRNVAYFIDKFDKKKINFGDNFFFNVCKTSKAHPPNQGEVCSNLNANLCVV